MNRSRSALDNTTACQARSFTPIPADSGPAAWRSPRTRPASAEQEGRSGTPARGTWPDRRRCGYRQGWQAAGMASHHWAGNRAILAPLTRSQRLERHVGGRPSRMVPVSSELRSGDNRRPERAGRHRTAPPTAIQGWRTDHDPCRLELETRPAASSSNPCSRPAHATPLGQRQDHSC